MFQAILKGKVRGIPAEPTPGSNWREWFGRTEDFLTAAVFTRLSYLPSEVLWTIIRTSAVPIGGDETLPPSAGDLVSREFWPGWNLALKDQTGQRKEPDVVLEFEHLTLVVEAKRFDDLSQYAEQWAAEVAACHQREDARQEPVWLLAVGGLGDAPSDAAFIYATALALFRERYRYHGDAPLRVMGCSWAALLAELAGHEKSVNVAGPHVARVVDDVREILRFYGFRNTHWVTDLARATRERPIRTSSLTSLASRLAARGDAGGDHFAWSRLSMFRGIRERSIEIMGGLR